MVAEKVFDGPMPGVQLIQALNLAVIAGASGRLLLHASCLVRGDRRVVLTGVSGSGKTTLTAGLLSRGWDYLSDELVAVDPATRRIAPYPKPLTVKKGSQEVLAAYAPPPSPHVESTWQIPASLVRKGSVVRHEVDGPTHIVLPRYDAASTAEVTPLSAATTMMAMGQNSSRLGHLFPHALDAIAATMAGCPRVRLTFGDLDAACDAIEALA